MVTNSIYGFDALDDICLSIKAKDYNDAKTKLQKLKDSELKLSLSFLLKSLDRESIENFQKIDISIELEKKVQLLNYLVLGYQYSLGDKQSSIDAYKNFIKAYKISDKIENKNLKKISLIALLDLFKREIFIGGKQYKPYLDEFENLKSDLTDEALYTMYQIIFYSKADENLNVNYNYYTSIKNLDSIFEILPKNHQLQTYYLYEKGIEHKIKDNYQLSENFFLKADSACLNMKHLKSLKSTIAWQLSDLNLNAKNIIKAREYLDKSISLTTSIKDNYYNSWLYAEIYDKENKFDFAYNCIKESIDIEYTLGSKNNTLESSILSVQNQTDKLKLDNLKSESRRKQNQNIAVGLAGSLALGSIIAFLLFKNTKRKQKLAEQQKELKTQKLATVLKEQELTSIDAMIEGQEKERQRIANDLHDDLGGLMATVKLHFNALKEKQSPELYDKTNELIDEAYDKVRTVAHAKNSGVFAKQGLLKAVNEMADKISASNKITINVVDHGLENRLENSLELTLFRIIQELITNTIKHAEATEVTIHITNHEDSLNLMVEDNGKGFNPSQITKTNKGMGISSIDKRVEHLNGTLTIESEKNQGTTIIIDIPI